MGSKEGKMQNALCKATTKVPINCIQKETCPTKLMCIFNKHLKQRLKSLSWKRQQSKTVVFILP